MDGSLGCMWTLELDLAPICRMLSSPSSLVDFLILRKNSKQHLLKVCCDAVAGELQSTNANALGTIAFVFNKLNRAYREHLDPKTEQRKVTPEDRLRSIVDQTDMYSNIFSLFEEDEPKVGHTCNVLIVVKSIN